MRVLVAEDDDALRSVLERGLRTAGYVVDAVRDGAEALDYLKTYEYAVVVLDWRMPVMSGLDVVTSLRRAGSGTPVVMLTARDMPADRVQGLDSGADDYVVKPFDFGELLTRLRAVQRRPRETDPPRLSLGRLSYEPASRLVTLEDHPVDLTLTELAILEILLRRSPGVVSRRSIAVAVWQEEADAVGSNTIDVHMARLRSKLAGARVRIETRRGVGYRLVAS